MSKTTKACAPADLDLDAVLAWLTKCNCHDLKKVRVTIGKQSWTGVEYKQTMHYEASMMACTHGKKTPKDTWTRHNIYLPGDLPTGHHKVKACFPYQDRDWYVATYIESKAIKGFDGYHPFGPNFIISPWDIPDSKIDDGERKPYKRIPTQIEYLP
jgi:hypothetical protein